MKKYLKYNENNGLFYWLKKPSTYSRIKVGGVAGYLNKLGYVQIRIHNKRYLAHRLAWNFYFGTNPSVNIDHINGIRNDNRISNLRLATQAENTRNKKQHREGKLVGCTFIKKLNKWQSQILKNGEYKYLGLFKTENEAHRRYIKELI